MRWCIYKVYFIVQILLLFSTVLQLSCQETEKGVSEIEDVTFIEDEPPSNYPYYPPCTDSMNLNKLSEKVKKIMGELESKLSTFDDKIVKLSQDIKMCNAATTKLENEISDIKKSESSYRDKTDEQIEMILKKLQKYFSKLSDAEKDVEEMDRTLSSRNKQLIGLEEKYETIEDSMKKVNLKIDEVTTTQSDKFKAQEDSLKTIQETMEDYVSNMTSIQTDVVGIRYNVTLNMQQSGSRRRSSRKTDDELPEVVEHDYEVLEVKGFERALKHKFSGQEKQFQVSGFMTQNDWKFFLVLKERRPCVHTSFRNDCQFIGVYLKLLSSEKSPIAAKFTVKFVDPFGNTIKNQSSSLKEYKKNTKFGWPYWISIHDMYQLLDPKSYFKAVLSLQLYPEGSFLYEQRKNETLETEWMLTDEQIVSSSKENRNISTIITLGSELGTFTEWQIYLGVYQNYIGVGVHLLDSKWDIAYASWEIKLIDYDEKQRAKTETYARDYKKGDGAIKDSHFISLDKFQALKRRYEPDLYIIQITFTLYGKDAKLYRDVRA